VLPPTLGAIPERGSAGWPKGARAKVVIETFRRCRLSVAPAKRAGSKGRFATCTCARKTTAETKPPDWAAPDTDKEAGAFGPTVSFVGWYPVVMRLRSSLPTRRHRLVRRHVGGGVLRIGGAARRTAPFRSLFRPPHRAGCSFPSCNKMRDREYLYRNYAVILVDGFFRVLKSFCFLDCRMSRGRSAGQGDRWDHGAVIWFAHRVRYPPPSPP
jgi:hypothetical protein